MTNNNEEIIRAWKDKAFRSSLQSSDLNSMPAHPAGSNEMTESELDAVLGGAKAGPTDPESIIGYSCDFFCTTRDFWCF